MRTSILIIFTITLLFSCNHDQNKTSSQIIPKDSLGTEDPGDQLKDSLPFKSFPDELYSNIGEMSLRDYDKDCYRIFLWQFRAPNYRIIRIERDSLKNVELIAKEITYSYKYNPQTDTVVHSIKLKLSKEHWDTLTNLANQSYFWSMEE